jgi:hypothetical protein
MKHIINITAFIGLLFILSCTDNKTDVSQEQVEGLRATSMEFMKSLKGILIEQIQKNGVVQAVAVCSDTAQVLTNNFGLQKGVYIRRVSLKNRNPNNYPDEFEKRILNQFQLLKQNNELNEKTEYFEVVKEDEFTYLRYIKPIILQAECLNCHGDPSTHMMGDVKQLIAQQYPEDKAVGYSIGDLRGAVSVKKSME